MTLFKIIKYQLYLLQLENYELGRYFKLLYKKGLWPKGEQRKSLVWTMKARLLFFLSVVTHFAILVFAVRCSFIYGLSVLSIKYYVLWILLFLSYFILYTLYVILLWPLDWLLKQIIIIRAKSKIKNLLNVKIIGIAGSYGKTTMKEVLNQVLGIRYKVLGTPESVNTPVGISRWILKNVEASTEILIVEMGEHYRGDIKDILDIGKLDIAVVTGINESHLERMKNIETVTETIFEIVGGVKPGGIVVLNGDDHRVMENYKQFVWPDHRLEFFGKNSSSEKCKVKSAKFDTEKLGWDLQIEDVGQAFVSLLGEYALGDVDAAVKIAKSLGMSDGQIITGIKSIKPVEHRLQPIKSNGNILVIDDAYNGNPDGVREAIKVLSRFQNHRKVFITPGLVEVGKASADVHRQIGKELAGVIDVLLLIQNSVTPYIVEGIKSTHFPPPAIMWFKTAQEAHSSLGQVLRPNDVVVFQNDWGDNYV